MTYLDGKLGGNPVSSSYNIVDLKSGENITLYQGSEAILRTDKSSQIVTKTDGVSDLTSGGNLLNNNK